MADSILKRLEDRRVMYVERGPDGVTFGEACDYYFSETLTLDEVRQLAVELLAIVDAHEPEWGPTSETVGTIKVEEICRQAVRAWKEVMEVTKNG